MTDMCERCGTTLYEGENTDNGILCNECNEFIEEQNRGELTK